MGTLAGYNLTTGSNNIDIGNQGLADQSGRHPDRDCRDAYQHSFHSDRSPFATRSIDIAAIQQLGLVAEDVGKVNPGPGGPRQ